MTVEFVAVVPLLLGALVLSFEFGRAFWAYDVITRDLRAAVRHLSRDASITPPYTSDACPASAQNIAQTGSPTDSANANKHFPWKDVSATFACPSTSFSGTQYNDSGQVVRMTASVPVTLSLLTFLNTHLVFLNNKLNQPSSVVIPISYSLSVTYQSRYIGN